MNPGTSPFEVKYTFGSQTFVKTLPSGALVAMKSLNVPEQITNRNFLAAHGITIYNYEAGAYYGQNTNTIGIPLSGGTLPYAFVANNVKPNTPVYVSPQGWSGTTTASAMTFSYVGAPASGVTSFITASNSLLANNQVSAATSGNQVLVTFSGASVTTTQWALAVLSGVTLPVGLTINGYGAGTLGAGSTVNLGYSANTPTAGFINLQRMI